MMGKTHIAVGIATSVLVMQPRSFEECILSVVGGSVGGILADIDILDNGSHDTLSTQLFAFGVSAALLAADYFFHLGICSGIMRNGTMFPTIGVVLFAMLCFAGVLTPHRGFTHSIAGILAYTASVALIYPRSFLHSPWDISLTWRLICSTKRNFRCFTLSRQASA